MTRALGPVVALLAAGCSAIVQPVQASQCTRERDCAALAAAEGHGDCVPFRCEGGLCVASDEERCDGADNDCDGLVDEGVATWSARTAAPLDGRVLLSVQAWQGELRAVARDVSRGQVPRLRTSRLDAGWTAAAHAHAALAWSTGPGAPTRDDEPRCIYGPLAEGDRCFLPTDGELPLHCGGTLETLAGAFTAFRDNTRSDGATPDGLRLRVGLEVEDRVVTRATRDVANLAVGVRPAACAGVGAECRPEALVAVGLEDRAIVAYAVEGAGAARSIELFAVHRASFGEASWAQAFGDGTPLALSPLDEGPIALAAVPESTTEAFLAWPIEGEVQVARVRLAEDAWPGPVMDCCGADPPCTPPETPLPVVEPIARVATGAIDDLAIAVRPDPLAALLVWSGGGRVTVERIAADGAAPVRHVLGDGAGTVSVAWRPRGVTTPAYGGAGRTGGFLVAVAESDRVRLFRVADANEALAGPPSSFDVTVERLHFFGDDDVPSAGGVVGDAFEVGSLCEP